MRRVLLNSSTVLQRRLIAGVEDHVWADAATDREHE
jgi:hypothetical protein